MKIQRHIDVQLNRRCAAAPADVVQYDTGIQLVFNVLDYEIPAGVTATMYIQKPSGKFVYQETGISIAGNVITVDLENQAVTEYGAVNYQVRFEQGTDLISTFIGIMRVEKSLADAGAVESKTVLAAFANITNEKIAEIQAAGREQINLVEQKGTEQITAILETAAEQIADIQTTAQNERDAIADKGLEVLNTIPADYTETAATAEKAVQEKAPVIVCEAVGNVVNVSDASDMPLQGLRVFGRTDQVKTTGKNLLPFGYSEESNTSNGVTATVNSDGSISFIGTATGYAGVPLYEGDVSVFPNVITIVALGTFDNVVLHIVLVDKNGSTILETNVTSTARYRTVDFSQYENIERITINAKRYTTGVVSGTVYPMVVAGKVDSVEYEPFTGGQPSPSPDYPQELVNVGNAGNIGVQVCGKNLLDISKYTPGDINGVAVTVDPDGLIHLNGTATIGGGRLNGRCNIVLKPGKYRIVLFDTNGTPQNSFAAGVYLSMRTTGAIVTSGAVEFEVTETIEYAFGINVAEGVTYNNDAAYVMVCSADADYSSYEPYKPVQTLTLSTPNGLPGIPVSSGGNYTDENGQQWVCDEIDMARGVYIQRIRLHKLAIADMLESEYYPGWNNVPYITDCVPVGINDRLRSPYITNIGKGVDGLGVSVNTKNSLATMWLNRTSYGMTLTEWKENYSDLVFEIMLPLLVPIETPLNAETIAAYRTLHTNKPNTTVFNDAGAVQSVEYAADTKAYIDNKIAQLATAMVNNA